MAAAVAEQARLHAAALEQQRVTLLARRDREVAAEVQAAREAVAAEAEAEAVRVRNHIHCLVHFLTTVVVIGVYMVLL